MALFDFFKKKRVDQVSFQRGVFPHLKHVPLILVSGSVGKSCIAYKLMSVLSASLIKTASLSLGIKEDIREAILIDGKPIAEEEWLRFLAKAQVLLQNLKMKSSRAALLFAMALLVTDSEKVSLCIIEDHEALDPKFIDCFANLSIIMTQGSKALLKRFSSFIDKADLWVMGSELQSTQLVKNIEESRASLLRGFAMGGFYDDENMDLSAMMLKALSKTFPIQDEILCQQIRDRPRGCFEVYPYFFAQQKGLKAFPSWLVLDRASNLESLDNFIDTVSIKLSSQKRRLLLDISLFSDKEMVFKKMKNLIHYVHLIGPIQLESKIAQNYPDIAIYSNQTLSSVIETLKQEESFSDEILMVCGPYAMLTEVRQGLKMEEPKDLTLIEKLASLGSKEIITD